MATVATPPVLVLVKVPASVVASASVISPALPVPSMTRTFFVPSLAITLVPELSRVTSV